MHWYSQSPLTRLARTSSSIKRTLRRANFRLDLSCRGGNEVLRRGTVKPVPPSPPSAHSPLSPPTTTFSLFPMSNSYDPYSSYPSSSKDTSGADHDFDFDHLLVSTKRRKRGGGGGGGACSVEGREEIRSLPASFDAMRCDGVEEKRERKQWFLPLFSSRSIKDFLYRRCC